MPAVRLVVRGRVQGVGFRWFVREAARALGVAGWVRNNADGSVELAASGSAEAIARLEAAVREGPPGAAVSDLDSTLMDEGSSSLAFPFTVER